MDRGSDQSVVPRRSLRGRAAIVTGAAGGIGSAIADRLRAEGADVLAVDLRACDPALGPSFAADLTTQAGNAAVVAEALRHFGRLDSIVVNAGIQHVAPISEFPDERWQELLALMLTSPFLLAKHGWAALTASGDARFVVVASAHGLVASPYKAAYVAAKHGVVGLVKALALEGAEHGLLATALCPGFVRTPLVEAQISAQAEAHGLPEDRVLDEVILAPHAVKRLLEPSEVAAAVAFLVGPEGRGFSGAALPMDLGWTAR